MSMLRVYQPSRIPAIAGTTNSRSPQVPSPVVGTTAAIGTGGTTPGWMLSASMTTLPRSAVAPVATAAPPMTKFGRYRTESTVSPR